MKRVYFALFALWFVLLSAGGVAAAEFKLWRIGSMDTGGKQYNIWYYTGRKPTLYGTTSSGSNVDIYVDDSVSTVRAEDTGNWRYDMGDIPNGNHRVTLSSEANKYSFILSLGTAAAASMSASLPVTGDAATAMMIGGASLAMIGGGYYLKKRTMIA